MTHAEQLIRAIRRKAMTYGDLEALRVSTCPWRRLSESGHRYLQPGGATLNTCGALCYPCYAAYLRETPRNYRAGKPETPTVADMKTRLRGRLSSPDLGRRAA